MDESKKAAIGAARDHVERNQQIARPEDVLIVGVEDSEIVRSAVVGGIGDFLETLRGKRGIDFFSRYGSQIEAWLRSNDREILIGRLDDDALQMIQAGNERVLQKRAFEVFQWRGFPEVKTAGIL